VCYKACELASLQSELAFVIWSPLTRHSKHASDLSTSIRARPLFRCPVRISMQARHRDYKRKLNLSTGLLNCVHFKPISLTVSTHRLQRLCFAPSNGMEYMFLPTTLPIACHNTGWRRVPLFIQTLRRMGKGRKSNPQPNCMFFKVCHSFAVLCERFPVIEFSGDGLKSVASFVTI